MNSKKLSPGRVACLTFLTIVLCTVLFGAGLLLTVPLLPPILPWGDVWDTVTSVMPYVAIGASIIAYFWAKTKQS